MAGSRRHPRWSWKALAALGLSIALLLVLYRSVDIAQLLAACRQASAPLLLLAFACGGPLSALSSWRYSGFAARLGIDPAPGFATALRSYFIAATFNLVLPSKLGDLGKGMVCQRLDRRPYPLSLHAFTVYEKAADLLALVLLSLLLALGTALLPASGRSGFGALVALYSSAPLPLALLALLAVLAVVLLPHRADGSLGPLLRRLPAKLSEAARLASHFLSWDLGWFVLFSVLLWALHLSQLALFAAALGIGLWSLPGYLLIATVLLVGLLPLSFAGVGTRDAALVLLLAGQASTASALLLGVLFTSRYVIPALVGTTLLRHLAAPSVLAPPLPSPPLRKSPE